MTIFEFNTIVAYCNLIEIDVDKSEFVNQFESRAADWKEMLLKEYEPEDGDINYQKGV